MPANTVLIIGDSGSGKSTSVEALPSEQTFIINVAGKPLPFKGWKTKYSEFSKENPEGNLLSTDSADAIVQTMEFISSKRPDIKYIVIDDSQYVAANEYMRRVKETGFQKFTDIGLKIYQLPTATRKLRNDLFVFFMSHPELVSDSEGNTKYKAKTLGKMIDNTITYEGLFSIVLFTYKKQVRENEIQYGFITNGDPGSTAKSPKGMFANKEIPNNLLEVAETITKYEE